MSQTFNVNLPIETVFRRVKGYVAYVASGNTPYPHPRASC